MTSDDSAHLKNTLGYLLRTTLAQAGTFRALLEREARSSRSWFEAAMQARRKKDLLADLGAVTYDLARSGELGDLEEYPEIADRVGRITRLAEEPQDGDITVPETEHSLEMAEALPAEPEPDWKPLFVKKH
jgi:hypothetical protein